MIKPGKSHHLHTLRCVMLLLALSVHTLAGCVSAPPPRMPQRPDEVAEAWMSLFRSQQMIPIFPPREDVEPGDVYRVEGNFLDESAPRDSQGQVRLTTRLMRLATPSESISEGEVALPSLSFTWQRGNHFGAALSWSGINAALDAVNPSEADISLELLSATSREVDVLDLVQAYSKKPPVVFSAASWAVLEPVLSKPLFSEFLDMVSRVYYARTIRVTIRSSSNVKLSLTATTTRELEELGFEVVNATSSSIRLSRTFGKPIALGYAANRMMIVQGQAIPLVATQFSVGPSSADLLTFDEQRKVLVLFNDFHQLAGALSRHEDGLTILRETLAHYSVAAAARFNDLVHRASPTSNVANVVSGAFLHSVTSCGFDKDGILMAMIEIRTTLAREVLRRERAIMTPTERSALERLTETLADVRSRRERAIKEDKVDDAFDPGEQSWPRTPPTEIWIPIENIPPELRKQLKTPVPPDGKAGGTAKAGGPTAP